MDYALLLLIPIILGLLGGYWLDQKTGKMPLFTLTGLILGVIMGIGSLYKKALLMQEKLEAARKKKKDDTP